jgi:DNA-binding CsgD family transcriptional regulator
LWGVAGLQQGLGGRIVEFMGSRDRPAATAKLLDRGAELREMSAALEDAAAGAGRLVVLRAPAGMGKSSLLAAAAGVADDRGLTALSARGSEQERELPLGLARQLFESLLRSLTAEERDRALSGAAAPARALLDLGSALPVPSGAGLYALYSLLASVSDERPLALLIDDAHWSDEPSLAFLSFLSRRLDDVAVVLLVAIRAGDRADRGVAIEAIATDPAATHLLPGPLSEASVASIVRDWLGAPAREFLAACHEVTGGNPFYLHELCRALSAAGVEPTAANAPQAYQLGPENVSRALLVRVGRSSRDAAALARSLAVLDDPAELRLAASLAGLDIEAATTAADVLMRADVLADERPLRFTHPIVRSAIASDLTAAEYAREHGRAARLLAAHGAPAERVAGHLLACEPAGDAWVTEQLRAAARVAGQRGAPAIAARYLRRALEEPAGAAAPDVLRELGAAELSSGEPAALEHLEQAAQLGTDLRGRVGAVRELARGEVGLGSTDRALELLSAAREDVADDNPELALELSAELSGIALLLPGSAGRVMEPLTRFADAHGDTAPERLLLANLSHWLAASGGSAERCADLAARGLAGGRLLAETRAESPAFYHAVFVLIAADRFAEAGEVLDAALDDARRQGSLIAFATASTIRSLLAYRVGRLAESEADARGAVDAIRLQGWPAWSIGVAFLIDALIETGRLDEAQWVLDESELGPRIPEGLVMAPVLAARGRLRIAAGDLAAGVEDLLEWGRRSDRGENLGTAGTPTFRTYAAPALAALGEEAEARRLIAEELELARRWGARRAIGMALHAAGLVEATEKGRTLLEQAVETLRSTDARLEHARALVELGAALRRSGRASDARAPLREGMDLAHRCGAAPLTARAQDELAASGVRRRPRTMLRGVESLTPSERRIAQLGATGRTNREIAQSLFITRKTVEMHLHNAYRKLDIDSRAELPRALTEEAAHAELAPER